jgi:hypothetical protein
MPDRAACEERISDAEIRNVVNYLGTPGAKP